MSKNKNGNSSWIKFRLMNSDTLYAEQPGVHDVLARKPVNDVVALNTLSSFVQSLGFTPKNTYAEKIFVI